MIKKEGKIMKKEYFEELEMEVVNFQAEDIIRTSNETEDDVFE